MIKAFIGRAGSGKDYQCKLLKEQGFIKLSFADCIRIMTSKILGINYAYMISHYDKLKQTKLFENLTLRNIMENLGSALRDYNDNFFIECLINEIRKNVNKNYCISDMRYINEYEVINNFCKDNNIEFECIFCDYHSDRYEENNEHESAMLANCLANLGYKDLQKLTDKDIALARVFGGVNNNLLKERK